MFVDLAATDVAAAYGLLVNLVTPRPIAWVSTVDPQGRVNLAPYSFFNLFGVNPPVVVFSPSVRPDGSKKDSLHNVESTGAFVVNVATEPLAEAVNRTAAELAHGTSEAEAAGLTMIASTLVAPPRVLEAAAALECRLLQVVPIGEGPFSSALVIGQVVAVHVDDAVIDPASGRVDPTRLRTIGRMGGKDYCRTSDLFALERPR